MSDETILILGVLAALVAFRAIAAKESGAAQAGAGAVDELVAQGKAAINSIPPASFGDLHQWGA